MATIDDLVKATRSRRVQVADLPDAPKLQPTVRSGGQYTVAVQQAGKNKLMDLADALSTINPMLKDYKGIADLELEEYEAQLRRTKPEDLKAQLQKTTDQFDSISRKGGFIEWMVSPINEVRKRRALGKAAHDQFVQGLISSEGRLNNPKEGDDKLTTAQIMKQEFDAFVEANPALQGQYANEGFTEAVNPTILQLTNRYDQQKANQSKADTLLGNTSSIYRLAKNATLGSAQYDIDMSKALEDWGDLNAFPPAKQIEVIQNVSEQLARLDGGERKARQFLTWAGQNLKVGNALFHKNEDQVDRIESLIEATAEASDRLRETDRKDRIDAKVAEFGKLANRLQLTGQPVEYTDRNGEIKQATSREELLKGFQLDADADEDAEYTYEVQQAMEKAFVNDIDPNQYLKNEITKESFNYKNLDSLLMRRMELLTKQEYSDIALKFPGQIMSIQLDIRNDMKAKVDTEMNRLIASGQIEDTKALAANIDGFITTQFEGLDSIAKHRFEIVREQSNREAEDLKEYNQFVGLKPEDEDDLTTAYTENLIFKESPDDIIEKATRNTFVIGNRNTTPKNRKEAIKYNEKYVNQALKDLGRKSSGAYKKTRLQNYRVAQSQGLKVVNPDQRFGAYGNLVMVEVGELSFEEREKARVQYFELARLSDVFTDVKILKEEVTPHGQGFDPKEDINPKVFKLIKPELLKSVVKIEKVEDVPDEIKEIADLIGADDYLQFIRDQINIQKSVYDPNFDK